MRITPCRHPRATKNDTGNVIATINKQLTSPSISRPLLTCCFCNLIINGSENLFQLWRPLAIKLYGVSH